MSRPLDSTGPPEEDARFDSALERKIARVLGEDEAWIHDVARSAPGPGEADFLVWAREQALAQAEGGARVPGARLPGAGVDGAREANSKRVAESAAAPPSREREKKGRSAWVAVPAAADPFRPGGEGGSAVRRPGFGDSRSPFGLAAIRYGTLAATLTMLSVAALFAVRAKQDSQDGTQVAVHAGEPSSAAAPARRGPTYLGSSEHEMNSVRVVPLPGTVDWSDEVDSSGPFRVVLRNARPARLDEGGELNDLEATVSNPSWSCPSDRITLLPDLFWVEVYDELDPPGSRPLWSRPYSRP